MLTRFALPACLALAFALPAQAQFTIPASAVTLNYTNNHGCSITAGQVSSSGTNRLIVNYTNSGTNWIWFSVRVDLRGTGFARIFESEFTSARSPNRAGVVMIDNITPALPTSITNGSATVTIQSCSRAPGPNDRGNFR